MTLTVESGIVGGIPGSGLDIGFLSFAEIDARGHVNVTKFGNRADGCGGFIGISQNAWRVVFVGTLDGGARLAVADGALAVAAAGAIRKFVPVVQQVSFNAELARERRQSVMFVTERAVFVLSPGALRLTEVAPGLRLREDVLDRIGFPVEVAPDVRTMDARIFRPGRMGLRDDLEGPGNGR